MKALQENRLKIYKYGCFREELLIKLDFSKGQQIEQRTLNGHQKAMKTGISTDEFGEVLKHNLKVPKPSEGFVENPKKFPTMKTLNGRN